MFSYTFHSTGTRLGTCAFIPVQREWYSLKSGVYKDHSTCQDKHNFMCHFFHRLSFKRVSPTTLCAPQNNTQTAHSNPGKTHVFSGQFWSFTGIQKWSFQRGLEIDRLGKIKKGKRNQLGPTATIPRSSTLSRTCLSVLFLWCARHALDQRFTNTRVTSSPTRLPQHKHQTTEHVASTAHITRHTLQGQNWSRYFGSPPPLWLPSSKNKKRRKNKMLLPNFRQKRDHEDKIQGQFVPKTALSLYPWYQFYSKLWTRNRDIEGNSWDCAEPQSLSGKVLMMSWNLAQVIGDWRCNPPTENISGWL